MSELPVIYTDPLQSDVTVEIVSDMDMLEEKLTNMPDVTTDEQAEVVSEYRAQFRAKSNALDKQRLAMTEGARQTVKMINDGFKLIIERAKRCTQLADNKLLPFMQEKERKRREAEEAERVRKAEEAEAHRKAEEAEEEARRIAAETTDAAELQDAEKDVTDARDALNEISKTPVAKPEAKSTEGVLGSKTQVIHVWKYRLVDISKVPEEWLIDPAERLDKGKLNTVARRDKDMAVVPGIEFYSEDRLASRAGVKS